MRAVLSVRGLLAVAFAFVGAMASAQPPVSSARTETGKPVALRVGAVVTEMPGFLALPVQAEFGRGSGVVDASGHVIGSVSTIVAGLDAAAAAKDVYLVSEGKVVAVGRTAANGAFDVAATRPGNFTLYVGPFAAKGKAGKLVRIDAAESVLASVTLQVPGDAKPAPAAQPPAGPVIGTPINGNDNVYFKGGRFTNPVSNDFYHLEARNLFRGIVTGLDESGARYEMANAYVYLVRGGSIVARTATGAGGEFEFENVTAGPYSFVATNRDVHAAPGAAAGSGAIAVHRILLKPNPNKGVGSTGASFKVDGVEDVMVNVAFQAQGNAVLPVLHLSPAPFQDLAPFLSFDGQPIAAVAAPEAIGGAGGGGGGGGGGFGGLAGLAAAAGIAAAAGSGGGGGGGNVFVASPLRR